MTYVIEGYPSPEKYMADLESKPELFRPGCCQECNCKSMWIHGSYERCIIRKDVNRLIEESVLILRFKCGACFHTASTLPDFICPRRWYLYSMQQLVIKRKLENEATRTIASDLSLSRDTVHRWFNWIIINHDLYNKELSSLCIGIGLGVSPNKFWLSLFTQETLSRVMFQLYKLEITVP
jgi:hypothetical protein